MSRDRLRWAAVVAGTVAVAAAIPGAPRFVAVAGAAIPVGAVVMRATGRLAGADWPVFDRLADALPAAAVLMLVATATETAPLPDHLRLWQHPAAATVRAAIAFVALALAARRLRRPGTTAAAVILAAYATLVTPLAADWLLGSAPGHPVSAIGMILAVQQVAAAGAAALLVGRVGVRQRRDVAALTIASMLGLFYLAFMDYLIVWYGNLPARVGFYLERERPMLVCAALALGLAAPMALFSVGRQRSGGAAMLAGLFLFDAWWVGGRLAALGIALLFIGVAALGFGWLVRREARGG